MPLVLRAAALIGASRLLKVVGISVVAVVAMPMAMLMAASGALAAVAGGAPRPVAGAVAPMDSWVVTQPFGCTGYYIEPRVGGCLHFHQGIDLAAPYGRPVRAVLGGRVATGGPTGPCGGYGIHVLIAHDATLTTVYGHLSRLATVAGRAVNAGEVVGYEGSTGCSSGPHLHFEVRRGGHAVDPREAFPGLFGSTRRG